MSEEVDLLKGTLVPCIKPTNLTLNTNKNVSFSSPQESISENTTRIVYFEGSKLQFSIENLFQKPNQIIELLSENKIKVLTKACSLKIVKLMRKNIEKIIQITEESVLVSLDEKNLKVIIDDLDYLQELRQKLFYYVSIGRIDLVKSLLRLPHSDINEIYVGFIEAHDSFKTSRLFCILKYSENLLMCAIRHNHVEMAEYLISNKINVSYSVQLMEFPSDEASLPITLQSYSCREMAYDRNLFDLVNLIDFFDEDTDSKIVCYIGKNLLKEYNSKCKTPRLFENNLSFRETDLNQMTAEAKDYLINSHESTQTLNECRDTFRNEVNLSIMDRYTHSKQSLYHNGNEKPNIKEFAYRGYKIKFDIKVLDEEEARKDRVKSSTSVQSPNQINVRPHTSLLNRRKLPMRSTSCRLERPKTCFEQQINQKALPKLCSRQESYLRTLKKCGLANSYCTPIFK